MTEAGAREGIARIGRALRERMGAERPGLFAPAEWKGRVIARAMADGAFRVALFRFVDVLPAVSDDARLLALAQEYFAEVGDQAHQALGWTVRALGRGGPFRRVAAKVLRHQVGDLARQFIAGDTPQAALGPIRGLWEQGCAVSVDLLGEVTVSRAEADAYRERYVALLDTLAAAARAGDGAADVNVSVKLSALEPLLSPVARDASLARAQDALRPILTRARQVGAHVHVDMEHHALKDLTLEAVKGLLGEPAFADGPSCGVVLQAYRRDAAEDLEALVAWARGAGRPVAVRLVKGAYWDQEVITHRQAGWPVPVWEDKGATDRQFEALTARLFENADVVRPAIGSHNLRSLAHAIWRAERAGVPREGFEIQVIHGMAEPLRRALVAEGYPVRVYCPVGAFLPGMAYLVRRLLENTANTSVLRQMYGEAAPLEDLLAPPAPAPAAPRPSPGPRAGGGEGGFVNEPHADFTDPDIRGAFAAGLDRARADLGAFHPAVIDGRPEETAETLTLHDPSRTDRRVATAARCGAAEADRALAGAVRAQGAWERTPAAERAAVLRRAAELLRRDRWDLAGLQVYEVGKGWEDADADVAEAIDFFAYYADRMERLGTPKRLGTAYPGEVNELAYRPLGVGAVIAPWNFPLAIPAGMVGAALVAGNGVVLKPSERAPASGARLCALLAEAGVPDGVLQFLPGAAEAGAALAADPRVAFVAFTGSRAVGLKIVRVAAETSKHGVKRVVAEMGGKNAVIVDETADLDEAVLGIVHSATGYQGQKCSACSRVIALPAVHDALVERLAAALASLPIGPAEDPDSRIGPLVDARARRKVLDYIAVGRGEAHPALVVEAVPDTGHFVGPALFTGVAPKARLFREEIFGPVLAVTQARDLDAALELANDSDYALTGGLFSRSPRAIERVKRGFAVGNLYVNRGITGALVGRQPFGGFRLSGVGSKVGGPDYLGQFLVPVSRSENTLRRGFAPAPLPESGPEAP